MKRIMLLVGVILVIGAVVGYGQEKVDTQKTAQSQENKTFDKPLDKRVEEAVSGMETYSREIQKEIEPIQDSKKRQKTFFSKLHEYLTKYVRDGSIKELLALEAQILKKGEGPDSIYGWFWGSVHDAVLKLAGCDPDGDIPVSDKILEIIQDEGVDDYTRSKYVIDIEGKIRDLHNKKMEVDEKTREGIYPVLIKIIDDTSSSSELRAEAAEALTSIGRNNIEITNYAIKLLDDKDDLVKDRIIWYCDLKNDKFRKKIVSMLANRGNYSKKVMDRIQCTLARWPSETSEAIPYLLEILKDAKDKEEFERIAMDLQEYNDATVIDPILKKSKEFGLGINDARFYLKNSLLLDYLASANDKDKLFVLNLIRNTSGSVVGDVYTPPYFDKAINILKKYISDPNEEIRLVVVQSYSEMIESIASTWLKDAQREGMLKMDDIKNILIMGKNNAKKSELIEEIDSSLMKIEKLKNTQPQ